MDHTNKFAVAIILGGDCSTMTLMTARNQEYGVELRIFNGVSSTYQEIEINNNFLSTECGDSYKKCEHLLLIPVTQNENNSALFTQQTKFIVVIPLLKALGLIVIGSTGLADKTYVLHLSTHECSPTAVYHIQNSYYTLCLNSESNILKLLELHLNTTTVENSYASNLEQPHLNSVDNMTNSLYVDLPSQSGSWILFANGYEIFYFEPLDYLLGELDVDLEENDCFATAIEYIGGWEMIVYCDNDRAVYVDINREFIFATVDFAKDGHPYVCPNPNVYLAVYAEEGYIQYANRTTKQATNFEVFSSEFDNGVCVGSMDTTLFAFTDRERGTRLLNASDGSIRSLSGATCINHPCQPLVVLKDRYLAIREKRGVNWYVSLLDTHNNFSLVLEAGHVRADLMATFGSQSVGDCIGNHMPTSSVVSLPTTKTLPAVTQAPGSHIQPGHTPVLVISLSVVAFVCIVVVVVVTVSVVVIYLNRWKERFLACAASPHVGFEQRRDIEAQMVLGTYSRGIYK